MEPAPLEWGIGSEDGVADAALTADGAYAGVTQYDGGFVVLEVASAEVVFDKQVGHRCERLLDDEAQIFPPLLATNPEATGFLVYSDHSGYLHFDARIVSVDWRVEQVESESVREPEGDPPSLIRLETARGLDRQILYADASPVQRSLCARAARASRWIGSGYLPDGTFVEFHADGAVRRVTTKGERLPDLRLATIPLVGNVAWLAQVGERDVVVFVGLTPGSGMRRTLMFDALSWELLRELETDVCCVTSDGTIVCGDGLSQYVGRLGEEHRTAVVGGQEVVLNAPLTTLECQGRRLALCGVARDDGKVRLIDLDSRVVVRLLGHDAEVLSKRQTPTGLVTSSADGAIIEWSLAVSPHVPRLVQDVRWARFALDGSHVLSIGTDGTARLATTDGSATEVLCPGVTVEYAWMQPGRRWVVFLTAEREFVTYDLRDRRPRAAFAWGGGRIVSVSLDDREEHLVVLEAARPGTDLGCASSWTVDGQLRHRWQDTPGPLIMCPGRDEVLDWGTGKRMDLLGGGCTGGDVGGNRQRGPSTDPSNRSRVVPIPDPALKLISFVRRDDDAVLGAVSATFAVYDHFVIAERESSAMLVDGSRGGSYVYDIPAVEQQSWQLPCWWEEGDDDFGVASEVVRGVGGDLYDLHPAGDAALVPIEPDTVVHWRLRDVPSQVRSSVHFELSEVERKRFLLTSSETQLAKPADR